MSKVLHTDCMNYMKTLSNKSVDFVLTDIPYNEVQQETRGFKLVENLDVLSEADELGFDLQTFLKEVYRITKNSCCIFCGWGQFSEIYNYFKSKNGTVRPVVFQKACPMPINGQYVYLNGVEFAVWFKKRGGKTFNANCKNTVFTYSIMRGKKRIHPTQKPLDLFKELILDNTNEGDLVFDPCAGGMTTAMAASETNRNFICCEINDEFYTKGIELLKRENIEFEEE